MRSPRRRVAAFTLVLALAACTGGSSGGGDVSGLLGDPERIVVGTNATFEPFEFVRDEEIVGFDIDLMNEIASRLGVTAEYVDVSFETIFDRLLSGDFDAAISAITITPEREATVTFAGPYFSVNQALVARPGSELSGVDDLAGESVAVEGGSTSLTYANEHFTSATIVEFPSTQAAFTALASEQVTAVFVDLPVAAAHVEAGEAEAEIVAQVDTGEQYGIGVHPDNAALAEAISDTLDEVIDDGTYEELYRTWFSGDVPEGFGRDG